MTRARDLADIGDGVIEVNSSTTAFEIRQLGTGNAFVVEDETNPDSTPFVIDASGNIGVGILVPGQKLDLVADGPAHIRQTRYSTNATPNYHYFRKSRGTGASPQVVTNGDVIGGLFFEAQDGTNFINIATIDVRVDGTPGTNDMPGRLTFFTTADGASTPTERMRIDSAGSIHIGQILENATISATAANGTMAYDVITNKAVLYYTTNASANWTWNFRGNSTTTLNSIMAIGQTLTIATLITNGSPAYYQNSQCQVDGTTSGVTQRWQGGTAPSSGNTNSIDVYSHTIIKTANATFTVLSSQTRF